MNRMSDTLTSQTLGMLSKIHCHDISLVTLTFSVKHYHPVDRYINGDAVLMSRLKFVKRKQRVPTCGLSITTGRQYLILV